MRPLLACVLVCACAPAEKTRRGPGDSETATDDTDDTETSDSDTETIDTDTDVATENRCPEVIPDPPGTYTETEFDTEEDFDFDGGGYLLTQSGGSIIARNRQGDTEIVPVPGMWDPSGMRVASNGDIVVAEPDLGVLRVVYRESGGNDMLASGMVATNGVAADSRGFVAFTDFSDNGRVGLVDVVFHDEYEIAASLPWPNGLSFTQDGERLFITVGFEIWVSERLSNTEFTAPVPFAQFPENGGFTTIALDVCDRIYTVDYIFGKVWRAEPDGTGWTQIVDIFPAGAFSAIRFGGGEGGWERDVLYVTNRNHLFAVPIGVNGIAPVAPVY